MQGEMVLPQQDIWGSISWQQGVAKRSAELMRSGCGTFNSPIPSTGGLANQNSPFSDNIDPFVGDLRASDRCGFMNRGRAFSDVPRSYHSSWSESQYVDHKLQPCDRTAEYIKYREVTSARAAKHCSPTSRDFVENYEANSRGISQHTRVAAEHRSPTSRDFVENYEETPSRISQHTRVAAKHCSPTSRDFVENYSATSRDNSQHTRVASPEIRETVHHAASYNNGLYHPQQEYPRENWYIRQPSAFRQVRKENGQCTSSSEEQQPLPKPPPLLKVTNKVHNNNNISFVDHENKHVQEPYCVTPEEFKGNPDAVSSPYRSPYSFRTNPADQATELETSVAPIGPRVSSCPPHSAVKDPYSPPGLVRARVSPGKVSPPVHIPARRSNSFPGPPPPLRPVQKTSENRSRAERSVSLDSNIRQPNGNEEVGMQNGGNKDKRNEQAKGKVPTVVRRTKDGGIEEGHATSCGGYAYDHRSLPIIVAVHSMAMEVTEGSGNPGSKEMWKKLLEKNSTDDSAAADEDEGNTAMVIPPTPSSKNDILVERTQDSGGRNKMIVADHAEDKSISCGLIDNTQCERIDSTKSESETMRNRTIVVSDDDDDDDDDRGVDYDDTKIKTAREDSIPETLQYQDDINQHTDGTQVDTASSLLSALRASPNVLPPVVGIQTTTHNDHLELLNENGQNAVIPACSTERADQTLEPVLLYSATQRDEGASYINTTYSTFTKPQSNVTPKKTQSVDELSGKILNTRERILNEPIVWKKKLLCRLEMVLVKRLKRAELESGNKANIDIDWPQKGTENKGGNSNREPVNISQKGGENYGWMMKKMKLLRYTKAKSKKHVTKKSNNSDPKKALPESTQRRRKSSSDVVSKPKKRLKRSSTVDIAQACIDKDGDNLVCGDIKETAPEELTEVENDAENLCDESEMITVTVQNSWTQTGESETLQTKPKKCEKCVVTNKNVRILNKNDEFATSGHEEDYDTNMSARNEVTALHQEVNTQKDKDEGLCAIKIEPQSTCFDIKTEGNQATSNDPTNYSPVMSTPEAYVSSSFGNEACSGLARIKEEQDYESCCAYTQ